MIEFHEFASVINFNYVKLSRVIKFKMLNNVPLLQFFLRILSVTRLDGNPFLVKEPSNGPNQPRHVLVQQEAALYFLHREAMTSRGSKPQDMF